MKAAIPIRVASIFLGVLFQTFVTAEEPKGQYPESYAVASFGSATEKGASRRSTKRGSKGQEQSVDVSANLFADSNKQLDDDESRWSLKVDFSMQKTQKVTYSDYSIRARDDSGKLIALKRIPWLRQVDYPFQKVYPSTPGGSVYIAMDSFTFDHKLQMPATVEVTWKGETRKLRLIKSEWSSGKPRSGSNSSK